MLEQCLQLLARYYREPLGPGDQLIQAHAPSAIARLLGRDGPASLVNYYRGMFLNELRNGTRESHDLYRSAVLALGQLSTPQDADQAECREVLLDWYHNSQDRQGRYFSLNALGPDGAAWYDERLGPEAHDLPMAMTITRAMSIYSGSNEIQRNIISKRVLGLPD